MSLSTQTNKISGVINFPPTLKTNKDINKFINTFKSFCESNSREFYIIYHNRDIKESGEFKTPHIHFLCDCSTISDRKRLSTHLIDISDFLHINSNLISIDTWRNYESGIQYLIHKNNPDKVLYNPSEILTNQSRAYLDIILSKELADVISIDYLCSLCMNSHTLIEIYKQLGLKDSKTYRHLIIDMFNEFHKNCLKK